MTSNNNINIFDLEKRVDILSDIKNEIEKIWEPGHHDIELVELRDSITKFKGMYDTDDMCEVEDLTLSLLDNSKELIEIKDINEEFENHVQLSEQYDFNDNTDTDINLEKELEKSGYVEPTMLEPISTDMPIDIEMQDLSSDCMKIDDDIDELDDYYFTGGVMDYVYRNKSYVITVIGSATVGGLLFGGVGVFFGAIPAVVSGGAGVAAGGVVGNQVAKT